MNVLPLNWQDKENSPQLLAFLQQFGEKSYLSAEEINQFRDALNHLHNLVGGGSGITNNTGFSFNGTDFVINALFGWKFNGTDFVLDTNLTIPVPYTTSGKHRTDVIIARNGAIIKLTGIEYDLNVPAPAPAFNLQTDLYITQFEVNEDGYGSPTGTVSGDTYIKKIYYQPFYYNGSGANKVIPLDPLGRREIVLTDANLESIKGFDLSLITGNPSAEQPILGFDLRLRNMTGGDVTLNHNDADAGVIVFLAKNGADVVIPNGEFIDLRRELANYNEGLRSWSDGGGGSQYPKVILFERKSLPDLTGTTAVTKMGSFTIPADTIPSDCVIRMTLRMSNSGTANNKFVYTTWNSVNVGVNIFTNYVAFTNSTRPELQLRRLGYVSGGDFESYGVANIYDEIGSTAAYQSFPFDVTIDNELDVWGKLSDASDTLIFNTLILEVLK